MTLDPIKTELGELFAVVNQDVIWLHTVWELFIQFYGSSDENFQLMNASAPQFFALLKIMLFHELVLSLNRLTDGAITLGHANACLEQLIEQTDQDQNSKLVESLRGKLVSIRANYRTFRTWRDKRVSHNDLSTALGSESDSLPGITRVHAESAIREIVGFMNEFSITMLGTSQSYVPFMVAHGDGNALMQHLKKAMKF